MFRRLIATAAVLAGLLCFSQHASAQLGYAKVVLTCGTVAPLPHVGSIYAFTMDVTGTLCTAAGGGGGGGTSSTFGASFPATGTAAGFEYLSSPPTLTSGQMVAGQTDVNGNLKTTIVSPVATSVNVTPTDCSGSITTGGTAQNAITAQTTLHGFTIANVDTGHSDEPLAVSFTTVAALGSAQSYPLAAPTATSYAGMGSYTTPPGFGTNHAVSIIGATTGHVFSCTWW